MGYYAKTLMIRCYVWLCSLLEGHVYRHRKDHVFGSLYKAWFF